MDGSGFYAFIIWTFFVGGLGWVIGNSGFDSTISGECKKHNEMVIQGTVFQCKPVALINKGVRAELK